MGEIRRKIGGREVTIVYQGHRLQAVAYLDKAETEYHEACKLLSLDRLDYMDRISEEDHGKEEDKKSICQHCGQRTLQERRGRMSTSGSGFIFSSINSRVSPYMYCSGCGNDQEIYQPRYLSEEGIVRLADAKIRHARRIKEYYEVVP